ncbi:unnamed protein product [Rotaria sp. Silwood1]|nr:unnamed protein product [Rotaria sp. Silwood1]
MSGATAYKTIIAKNGGVDAPRNATQCNYRRQKFLNNQKVSHDELSNILAFRNVIFSERPTHPLAIVMHDRKLQTCHERFVQVIFNELPNLHKKCVLITDAEDALKNAFRKHFPTMCQLRCWNHCMSDIGAAAKKYFFVGEQTNVAAHGDNQMCKREIIDHVIDTIKNLLRAQSYDEFYEKYRSVCFQWPKQFLDYFETNILPVVNELGGWSSRKWNLFNEESGITNNPIESMNAVYKRWLGWKQLSLDALVQMFYLVLGYYVNESRRGLCSYGGYHLESEYNDAKTDVSQLTLISGYSPDEVLEKIKSTMGIRTTPNAYVCQTADDASYETCVTNLDNINIDDNHKNENSTEKSNDKSDINNTLSIDKTLINDVQQATLTNTSRASLLLEQNLVKYHSDTKAFTVRSLDRSSVHAVHMNDPKRLFRCSCPNTLLNCSHVLAVKQFLGMPLEKRDNQVNLGHARKQKRIEDKIPKAGGKRPRRCDKQSNTQYTSPYFSGTHSRTTSHSETHQHNYLPVQLNSSNNTPVARILTDISNLSSPTTFNMNTTPKIIKAIRFLTPVSLDDLYSVLKQVYIDGKNPVPYPAANKQLQQRLVQFVSKGLAEGQSSILFDKVNSNRTYALERHNDLIRLTMIVKEDNETKKLIVLSVDEEIQVIASSFIRTLEETGYIESAPKCYQRLYNTYAISNKRIRIVQRTLGKFITSTRITDENEDEAPADNKIECNTTNDETSEDEKNNNKEFRNIFKANQNENVQISSSPTSHTSITTRSKAKLCTNENGQSSEANMKAEQRRKKMKRSQH